ncbi:1422_t:CDS:1, partial [Racocetra persica]
DYFEKEVNNSKEFWVCKVVNKKSSKKCSKKYKNIGSLTGNLITYLRNNHKIVSQNDIETLKKVL